MIERVAFVLSVFSTGTGRSHDHVVVGGTVSEIREETAGVTFVASGRETFVPWSNVRHAHRAPVAPQKKQKKEAK